MSDNLSLDFPPSPPIPKSLSPAVDWLEVKHCMIISKEEGDVEVKLFKDEESFEQEKALLLFDHSVTIKEELHFTDD